MILFITQRSGLKTRFIQPKKLISENWNAEVSKMTYFSYKRVLEIVLSRL